MPVHYRGILQEHEAVRKQVGLFDISHMGEIFVSGPDAALCLNQWLTNDVGLLQPGQGQYTLLLNPQGGVIDDLLCYRIGQDQYLLVVNAARIAEDYRCLSALMTPRCKVDNQSTLWAAMAIQGPKSANALEQILDAPLPSRNGIQAYNLAEGPVWIARTGYTGEDGFEWFCPSETGVFWWNRLLKAGESFGIAPCGLGCRDTLRLEMGFPLNGSDLSLERTPLEAGLGAFVKLQKGAFIGSEALRQQKEQGIPTRLCGLVMEGKTPPPRAHYPIVHEGKVVGETTSGSLSPSLQTGIAMAYLPGPLFEIGTKVHLDIRGKLFPATVSKRPMYSPGRTN